MEYKIAVRGIVSLCINESLDEIKKAVDRMSKLLHVEYSELFNDVMCQMAIYKEA